MNLPLVPALSPAGAKLLVGIGVRGMVHASFREVGSVVPPEVAAALDALDVIAATSEQLPFGFRGRTTPAAERMIEGVTVDTAANELHVSPRRVRQMVEEGRLEATRPQGHAWLIARQSLDDLIVQRRGA